MNPTSMDALMRKLYSIQRVLAPGAKSQPIDEFEIIKRKIVSTLTTIRNKTDEKEKNIAKFGATLRTLQIGEEIKSKLEELDQQLTEMNNVLRQQHKDHRKYGVNELMIKDRYFANFQAQKEDLKAREEVYKGPEIRTILDVTSGMPRDLENRGPVRDLTEEEARGLESFERANEQQDAILTEIIDVMGVLTVKARNLGDLAEQQGVGIGTLDTEMDKAIFELEGSSNKLKQVLVKYRKPEKFCMDVCLLVVLLGLISVIINMITN